MPSAAKVWHSKYKLCSILSVGIHISNAINSLIMIYHVTSVVLTR